jgi:hypothetical protein
VLFKFEKTTTTATTTSLLPKHSVFCNVASGDEVGFGFLFFSLSLSPYAIANFDEEMVLRTSWRLLAFLV